MDLPHEDWTSNTNRCSAPILSATFTLKKSTNEGLLMLLDRLHELGWHRFYVNDKIKVEKNDAIVFRVDKRVPTGNKPEYKDSPDALFNYVRAIDLPDGVITAVKQHYGQKLVNILGKHCSFKSSAIVLPKTIFKKSL